MRSAHSSGLHFLHVHYSLSRLPSKAICFLMYALVVYILVPSDSIVSPSLNVQSGSTPLLKAAQNGHGKVACFLLEHGSSVREEDNVG